ncbi:MAG: TlpA disulfide reductase family protein [Saprospiraceae bacterium]|nr:TlpA disulfide reductase family protein [Saprospiraceae bacterium]
MKILPNISTIALLCIILFTSCQSDPIVILKASKEKCKSIKNGYYEMDHYMKYMSGEDTTYSSFNCFFEKLEEDSIYSSAFHYQRFHTGEYSNDVIYTGENFVNFSTKDSIGQIMSKELWAKDIKSYSHNYTFYTPLTHKTARPIPKDSTFLDEEYIFDYVGEESIQGSMCHHIRMRKYPEEDTTEMMQTLLLEVNYWINKEDLIPIQYTTAFDLSMNNDTMHQFEKNVLTSYTLDHLKEEENLKLSSIPSYVKLKDYTPYESPDPLAEGTEAPTWSLPSLKGKTINLTDFKGELVLVDFFYKSCYPCMQAIPGLQALHEKYGDKGLNVIGIDPFDTIEEDNIDEFLTKRGVTYTILLSDRDIPKTYNVSGYPTLYLVDKGGKILHAQVGYGKESEKELEDKIASLLQS